MNPWSLFWRQGHSTTFGNYFKEGYEGAVADWWQSNVNSLTPDLTILEVGCGNCSLLPALIKSEIKAKYIGVDLASVAPSGVAQKGLSESDIELVVHSETPAEQIPEADASVDLIASVFGIEYSNLEKSFTEVSRLLKPGGRFAALLHHASSVVTGMSARAISEYDEEGLSTVLSALSTISAERDKTASLQALKANPLAEQARSTINLLAEKYLSNTDPATANATMFEFMTHALGFFKMMGANSAQRGAFIAALAHEHRASHERFRQMVAVAFDDDGIDQLKVILHSKGLTDIQSNVIHTDKEILGWELCAKK
jgi:ubiquinone/menaquinone biosynthesis C-methylase UbiE